MYKKVCWMKVILIIILLVKLQLLDSMGIDTCFYDCEKKEVI